jgi:hypothetical protein
MQLTLAGWLFFSPGSQPCLADKSGSSQLFPSVGPPARSELRASARSEASWRLAGEEGPPGSKTRASGPTQQRKDWEDTVFTRSNTFFQQCSAMCFSKFRASCADGKSPFSVFRWSSPVRGDRKRKNFPGSGTIFPGGKNPEEISATSTGLTFYHTGDDPGICRPDLRPRNKRFSLFQ